jgi:hypothetical protein
MDFNYYIPTRIVSGRGCIKQNAELLSKIGKKSFSDDRTLLRPEKRFLRGYEASPGFPGVSLISTITR